jgi:hypothetical protein
VVLRYCLGSTAAVARWVGSGSPAGAARGCDQQCKSSSESQGCENALGAAGVVNMMYSPDEVVQGESSVQHMHIVFACAD